MIENCPNEVTEVLVFPALLVGRVLRETSAGESHVTTSNRNSFKTLLLSLQIFLQCLNRCQRSSLHSSLLAGSLQSFRYKGNNQS